MKGETNYVNYRFAIQYPTKVGEKLYLVGGVRELGDWNTHKAINMNYESHFYWTVQVSIPQEMDIEFKYFIGPFERWKLEKPYAWLGNENSRLRINQSQATHFQQKDKSLRIMSFNVRFQNPKDKQQFSWNNRRDNCAEVFAEFLPDIVGIQEPKSSQRKYLMSRIGSFYNYYGKPRNLIDDEQSGIFIRKDKFYVLEDEYIWINEGKVEGKKGFGARLPRYFTYLLVAPFNKEHSMFLIFNTHLDHQTPLSKLQGIKYISETIQSINEKYNNKIKDVFVTGDFNTSDDDQIFKFLMHQEKLLKSMRNELPERDSDLGATFNGFAKMLKYIDKTMKFFNLDPGATIDHIFFKSENYKPIAFQCLRNDNKIISDHFPIMGIFQPKRR